MERNKTGLGDKLWRYDHFAMPKQQKLYSQTYLNFLQLVQSLRNLPDFVLLDPVEERLLHLFATVWQADQKITVLQAMAVSRDVSSTTAHRRLKSMRQKGVLEVGAVVHAGR